MTQLWRNLLVYFGFGPNTPAFQPHRGDGYYDDPDEGDRHDDDPIAQRWERHGDH